MRTLANTITLALWLFILTYFGNKLGVPKNMYYFITVVPLGLGGMFLINYFFDRKNDKR
ncbi:hypothetical protein [Paenibacillus puerhi]|uniref:hypothetical protein n=1 Tax=Paenibacillus puerhi TaxID=2692622 RepID=UPI00135AD6D3|nr:hypothetical protein [Paenibacillus puerhi]